ncbi:MAG TPA: CPXCG motif-containing cysteine-rich protein [Steroidobacteraceae bacterium]
MAAHKDNPPEVDELYGLEPVFEPGDAEATPGGGASLQLRTVQCPYCGEPFETMVDFSSGSTSYIEDCAICCRPIEFLLEVADRGTTAKLQVGRSD